MMQLATAGLSPPEVLMWVAGFASMALNWRFAASVSAMKLDIRTESDRLRNELLSRLDDLRGEFLPGKLAEEQRSSILQRTAKAEEEIQKNRDRIHDLDNSIRAMMLGPLQVMQAALTDKARRMAAYDERSRVTDEHIDDLEDRINDLERRK